MKFTRYANEEKKRNQLFNLEWQTTPGCGGFCLLSKTGFTFLHRLFVRGQKFLGNEQEFVLRWQTVLDKEPKYSWWSMEFFNFYEARIFYIWLKMWKDWNIKFVLNLGWRTTRATRDFLERQALEKERSQAVRMFDQAKKVNKMREVI